MAEVKVKVGKKMSEAEQKAADPQKTGRLTAQPRKRDVEPEFWEAVRCPYCGCIGYCDVSPYVTLSFICHCCGGVFTA